MHMKSILFITLFLATCTIASAQQEKGDFVVRFNASYVKYGTADGFAFLNLKGGYFFTQNIEAGVEPSIMLSSLFTQLSLGVYGTYNFILPDAKMVPYAGLRLSTALRSLKVTDINGGSTHDNKGSANFGVYGGLRYFITERVSVDSGLSYDIGQINVLQFQIGLGVIIGRK